MSARKEFPPNRTLTLAAADRIKDYIITHGRDQALRACTALGLSPKAMLAFIERNADMLPPRDAA